MSTIMKKCPGLVVMADDSRLRGPWFESRRKMQDRCYDFLSNMTNDLKYIANNAK